MNKTILRMAIAGVLLAAGTLKAETMDVEWVLRGGLSWKGQLSGRDGEFVQLKRPQDAKAVGVGVSTIKEITFEVDLDDEEVEKLMKERKFGRVISKLERALKPFAEYSDIPSNLTPYNAMLMEAYYRTQEYDKTLIVAKGVASDDRDPELQEKSRMYQVLALIDGGKAGEAEALIAKFGWDKNVADDAPPEKLYIAAKLLALKKQYSEAMLYVAKVIAFNSQDLDWMQPAEMLCAEIYTELGLYDSAEEVCRQIELLYKDSTEFDQAAELRVRIDKLRAEKRRQESLKSQEA